MESSIVVRGGYGFFGPQINRSQPSAAPTLWRSSWFEP